MGTEIEVSSSWKQDGVAIDRVTATCSGTIDILDTDVSSLHLTADVMVLVTARVVVVNTKEERNGDVVRKVVLKLDEGRTIRSEIAVAKLKTDYGFANPDGIIDVGPAERNGDALAEAAQGMLAEPSEPKPSSVTEEEAQEFIENHIDENGELDDEGRRFVESLKS